MAENPQRDKALHQCFSLRLATERWLGGRKAATGGGLFVSIVAVRKNQNLSEKMSKNKLLKLFYEESSHKEGYDLIQRKNLIHRKGVKKFVAYDDRFEQVTDILNQTIKNWDKRRRMRILDIGCGDGVYEGYIESKLRNKVWLCGVDISTEQLKKSEKIFDVLKEVDVDNQKLPFKDSYFDLIICSEVMEHLFFPQNVISEAARLLRKGGLFIITVPNIGALHIRLNILLRAWSPSVNFPSSKHHIRFYNFNDIKDITKENFEIITEGGAGSLLFGRWNAGFYLPMPRFMQVFANKYFKSFAGGCLFLFKKKF